MNQKSNIQNIEEFEAAVLERTAQDSDQQLDIIEYVQGVKNALSSLVDQVVVDQEESTRVFEQTREELDLQKEHAAKQSKSLEVQIRSLQSKCVDRETKLKETQSELDRVVREFHDAQTTFDEQGGDQDEIVTLKNKLHDAKEAIKAGKQRVKKLEGALNDQADVVEAGQELKMIHEDHLAEMTAKDKKLKTAKQAAKARTTEVVSIKKKLVEAQKNIDAFDERQAGTVEALAQEQQELDAARARIDTLESKLREKMQRMEPLKEELAETTAALSTLQASHEKVASAEATMKKELRDVEKQITKLNYSLEEERTVRADAEHARDEALASANTQELHQELRQHQERIGALETTEHASADTIVALKKALAELEQQRAIEQQRLIDLRERAKATLGVDQQKDARVQFLEGKLEAFQHEKHGQQDMHHHLHEQIHSLEEQLKSTQKVNEVLKSQQVDVNPVEEPRVDIDLKVLENNNRLGNLLLQSGVITQEQLDEVLLERQHPDYNRSTRIGQQFVDKGYANEDVVAQAVAHQMTIPFLRIERNTVKYSAVRFVNKQMATMHQCIPAFVQAGNLMVAMVNPMDLVAIEDIERSSGLPVKVMVSTSEDVQDAIKRHYR